MVHDPRVSTLLSRLGGLYRDPLRVDRDASSLLKSSVGVHLTPGIAPLVENNGDSSHCLVLQGTIAIVFRGQTYQLLVDIYLPSGYPIRPPISYVRLAENMYLKENHPHVGSDGMVYMPYTHEWNPRTHSLIEMVVAMSSVFSADPPVFTRAAPAPAPLPPPPPPVAAAVASNMTPYVTTSSNRSPPPPAYSSYVSPATSSAVQMDSERYMQEQIEAIMAKEAEEANRAAEIARKAAREEEERVQAQKEWEAQKTEQIRDQVNEKIRTYLQQYVEENQSSLAADWRDQEQLKQTRDRIEADLKDLVNQKSELEKHLTTLDAKTKEIEEWLEASKNAEEKEPGIDNVCEPINKLHAQMLDLSAENAALTDLMYFLDRGMYAGQIDCTTHLKMIRKHAKQQFLIRAHLIKINAALQKQK
ncbi:UEV domain containing protein [Nitzschia inconspicua]|uniref:UEV domain containing protein n=1 Tax=Nitzschia inconspicua TaxID=303405 RepID=A0A9K3PZ59_9STRA|nr:UEV domain containing protein [Nitzschia inconspicua]